MLCTLLQSPLVVNWLLELLVAGLTEGVKPVTAAWGWSFHRRILNLLFQDKAPLTFVIHVAAHGNSVLFFSAAALVLNKSLNCAECGNSRRNCTSSYICPIWTKRFRAAVEVFHAFQINTSNQIRIKSYILSPISSVSSSLPSILVI